jgi:hypothetical protein
LIGFDIFMGKFVFFFCFVGFLVRVCACLEFGKFQI